MCIKELRMSFEKPRVPRVSPVKIPQISKSIDYNSPNASKILNLKQKPPTNHKNQPKKISIHKKQRNDLNLSLKFVKN